MRLNERLQNLSPFAYCGTGYPFQLDANESCLPLPDEIREELAQELRALDLSKYPDDRAAALREAFARFFSVDAENVVAGNGSDELIRMIVGALLPDDGVVLGVERDFGSYWSNAAIYGRKAFKISRRGDMTFSADELIDQALMRKADAVMFSNPNNPSGSMLTRDEVLDIVQSLDCLVVVDEAYMDFADQSVLCCVGKYQNLIVLRTLSKSMGAAGARLGFAVTTAGLAYALRSVRDAYNVSAVDQMVGRVLLSHPAYREQTLDETRRMMDHMEKRLSDIAARAHQEVRLYPSHTNFMLLWMQNAAAVSEALHAEGISLRLLDDHLIRISASRQELLDRALDALERYLTQKGDSI